MNVHTQIRRVVAASMLGLAVLILPAAQAHAAPPPRSARTSARPRGTPGTISSDVPTSRVRSSAGRSGSVLGRSPPSTAKTTCAMASPGSGWSFRRPERRRRCSLVGRRPPPTPSNVAPSGLLTHRAPRPDGRGARSVPQVRFSAQARCRSRAGCAVPADWAGCRHARSAGHGRWSRSETHWRLSPVTDPCRHT